MYDIYLGNKFIKSYESLEFCEIFCDGYSKCKDMDFTKTACVKIDFRTYRVGYAFKNGEVFIFNIMIPIK